MFLLRQKQQSKEKEVQRKVTKMAMFARIRWALVAKVETFASLKTAI